MKKHITTRSGQLPACTAGGNSQIKTNKTRQTTPGSQIQIQTLGSGAGLENRCSYPAIMGSRHHDLEINGISGKCPAHRPAVIDMGDPLVTTATAKNTAFLRGG